jgi:hypothetical protein
LRCSARRPIALPDHTDQARARTDLLRVFSDAKHVSLEFGAGGSLPDRYGVLEGGGKFRRHIKLTSVDEIAGKHVRKYLALALAASLKADRS